jgi:L-2-hydroxyglutarate oxidase LhgO
LHAGFYYSPDSLKAKFCREGNFKLREIISKNSIPIIECGKVVVTQNVKDEENLLNLYDRGLQNGVSLELHSKKDLIKFEPLASTIENFLWSPNTAVSDPILVLEALRAKYLNLKGELILGTEVQITENEEVWVNSTQYTAEKIINASGTSAIHFAKLLGVGEEYSILPVLGRYKVTSFQALPLRTLIYPVPNPINPFLGVHFTKTYDGRIKIGPTAIPVIGREQYSLSSKIEIKDLHNTFDSLYALGRESLSNLLRLALTEYPKLNNRWLIHEGAKIVPMANKSRGWQNKPSGIRAQLVNIENGKFEQDFVVREKSKFVHILNAVSPGWTASIPFADWVVEKYCA